MTDAWEVRSIGDLVEQRREKVTLKPGQVYRTMGVRWYGRGAYLRGEETTETIKARALWRARSGDFIFNRIDTQKGAFDVVGPDLDGALVTNEFPVYMCGEAVDARFLLLHFQRPDVLRSIEALRGGSEGRARWKEADFESSQIALPPRQVQRQVIDVMSHLDKQVAGLQAERLAALELHQAMKSHLLVPADDWLTGTVSDFMNIQVGFPFKSGLFTECDDDVFLVRGDNIEPGGVRTTRAKRWPSHMAHEFNAYQLNVDDVVIAMDRTWISSGLKVAVISQGHLPALLVQRVARVTAKPMLSQALVPYFFDSQQFEALVRSQQTGTSVPHISAKQIEAMPVRIPSDRNEQARLASLLGESLQLVKKLEAEVDALVAVRTNLLVTLLSGQLDLRERLDPLLLETS